MLLITWIGVQDATLYNFICYHVLFCSYDQTKHGWYLETVIGPTCYSGTIIIGGHLFLTLALSWCSSAGWPTWLNLLAKVNIQIQRYSCHRRWSCCQWMFFSTMVREYGITWLISLILAMQDSVCWQTRQLVFSATILWGSLMHSVFHHNQNLSKIPLIVGLRVQDTIWYNSPLNFFSRNSEFIQDAVDCWTGVYSKMQPFGILLTCYS